MAITYFGTLTSDDFWGTSGSEIYYGTYTCPGSGNRQVSELSALSYRASGDANIRMAIYSADGSTKIAEGTAEVAIVGSSGTWQGHIGVANISPNPVNLVGGTNYIIVLSCDAALYTRALNSSGTMTYRKASCDYTGGFPSSITLDGTENFKRCFRCGVEDAVSSGVSIPVFMSTYRRRR